MDILREYSREDLYMRYAMDSDPDDRNSSMHVHEQCEIFYFLSGNTEYLVEGSRYPLKAGSILIMRPSESHRVKILGGETYERCAINFSLSVIQSVDPQNRLVRAFYDRPLGRGNLYHFPESGHENMRELFLEALGGEDDYEKRLRILSLLFRLLDRINRDFLNRGTSEYLPPQSTGEKMVSYVNGHLFDELTVSALAGHFYLSNSQFSRVFKQATGTSPWEYITIKRLAAAREKIRGGMSAQNAGMDSGFGDYSSFYRAYVKYFGCTPKADSCWPHGGGGG